MEIGVYANVQQSTQVLASVVLLEAAENWNVTQ